MIVVLLLVSLMATVLGAICGIGGGVIIRPMMDAVSGLPVSSISFVSGLTVLSMSLASLLTSGRKGVPITARTALLAVGAALGGLLGKQLFSAVKAAMGQDALVGMVQNGILLLLCVACFFYTWFKSRIRTKNVSSRIANVAIGAVLGVLSSFLGIGGGPFNLLVLSYFLSMDSKTAAVNSIFVILVSQLASLGLTLLQGLPPVPWPLLLLMPLGGVIGGILGRTVARKISNQTTDRLFYLMLGIIIVICLWNLLRYGGKITL